MQFQLQLVKRMKVTQGEEKKRSGSGEKNYLRPSDVDGSPNGVSV
jgi:hypothetical protein